MSRLDKGLNNRGGILGPSDLEWWLMPSTSPWNNSSYHPGGTGAEDPRPEQFLRVQFAIAIDTAQPLIQRQLKDGFKTAETFLRNKKSFCLEFDFDKVVLDWWLNQGPKYWLRLDCMDTAYCIGGRVGVTNTSQPYHGLDFGIWWSLCLPCYCLLAIPYKVWRSIVCQIWDHRVEVVGNVQVVRNIKDLRIHQRTLIS